MTKFNLDVIDEYPYIMLGINTSLKSYRMAWNINKTLGIALKKLNPIAIANANKEVISFTMFNTFVPHHNAQYRLVENRNAGNLFIPEQPRSDYFLLVDESPEVDVESLVKKVRDIKSVSMAYIVDIDSLKSKQNIFLTL